MRAFKRSHILCATRPPDNVANDVPIEIDNKLNIHSVLPLITSQTSNEEKIIKQYLFTGEKIVRIHSRRLAEIHVSSIDDAERIEPTILHGLRRIGLTLRSRWPLDKIVFFVQKGLAHAMKI